MFDLKRMRERTWSLLNELNEMDNQVVDEKSRKDFDKNLPYDTQEELKNFSEELKRDEKKREQFVSKQEYTAFTSEYETFGKSYSTSIYPSLTIANVNHGQFLQEFYLSNLGGTSPSYVICKMMDKIMTQRLGSTYTKTRNEEKSIFDDLLLSEIVVRKSQFFQCFENIIAKNLSDWSFTLSEKIRNCVLGIGTSITVLTRSQVVVVMQNWFKNCPGKVDRRKKKESKTTSFPFKGVLEIQKFEKVLTKDEEAGNFVNEETLH